MNSGIEKTIGEVVASDYRLAAVFKKFGIDFCCKGDRSLEKACADKGIDSHDVLLALETVTLRDNTHMEEVNSWSLTRLIDHIEEYHHRYVEKAISDIKPFVTKINSVHGEAHPELKEIKELFMAAADELTTHMKKEELLLFPYVRAIDSSAKGAKRPENSPFKSVEDLIDSMKDEHTQEGDRFERISLLSNRYTPPEDACKTYRATYVLLQDFEEDLHRHIHLENNILFPKALELEKSNRI